MAIQSQKKGGYKHVKWFTLHDDLTKLPKILQSIASLRKLIKNIILKSRKAFLLDFIKFDYLQNLCKESSPGIAKQQVALVVAIFT